MKPQNHFFLILAFLLPLASCVSVNIKGAKTARSKEYQFREPSRPFEKMKNEQADEAWQNSQSGNTVAVLSECSDQKDPSLTTLEGETIQALSNYHVLSSQDFQFQDRAARRSQVEGSVDGVPVKMDVVVFKKNSCSYTLTYLGRAEGFEKDKSAFEQFLKGFSVP